MKWLTLPISQNFLVGNNQSKVEVRKNRPQQLILVEVQVPPVWSSLDHLARPPGRWKPPGCFKRRAQLSTSLDVFDCPILDHTHLWGSYQAWQRMAFGVWNHKSRYQITAGENYSLKIVILKVNECLRYWLLQRTTTEAGGNEWFLRNDLVMSGNTRQEFLV